MSAVEFDYFESSDKGRARDKRVEVCCQVAVALSLQRRLDLPIIRSFEPDAYGLLGLSDNVHENSGRHDVRNLVGESRRVDAVTHEQVIPGCFWNSPRLLVDLLNLHRLVLSGGDFELLHVADEIPNGIRTGRPCGHCNVDAVRADPS